MAAICSAAVSRYLICENSFLENELDARSLARARSDSPLHRAPDTPQNGDVTSLTVSREPRRNEKTGGYLDFKRLQLCAHVELHPCEVGIVCCGYVEHLEPFRPVNYMCIVAFSRDSLGVFFYDEIIPLLYSTTVKTLSLIIYMQMSYPSLRI